MATLTYREPSFVGSPNIREPFPVPFQLAQNAVFRRGDILVLQTTGAITNPPNPGTGSLSGVAGPLASAVTIVGTAAANAPATTYFIYVSYSAAGPLESLPSQLFVFNAKPGQVPQVTVASAGAPAAATGFHTYIGLVPDATPRQDATAAGTALGSAFTGPFPLTNYIGAAEGATNLSGNILGVAQHASNENYYDGYGGSFTAGTPNSGLGATNTIAPLTPTEAPLAYIITLDNGTLFEFNLNVASGGWQNSLIGTQAGLTLDATTGWWTVDTTQTNKVCKIVDHRPGVYIGPTTQGNALDAGVRVVVEFLPAALAI